MGKKEKKDGAIRLQVRDYCGGASRTGAIKFILPGVISDHSLQGAASSGNTMNSGGTVFVMKRGPVL